MKILQQDKDKGNGKHGDIGKGTVITCIAKKCNLFIIPLYIGTAGM